MSNYWKGFILVGAVNVLCFIAGKKAGYAKGYDKGHWDGAADGNAMYETAIRIMDENAKQVDLLNKKVREVNRAIAELNGEDS